MRRVGEPHSRDSEPRPAPDRVGRVLFPAAALLIAAAIYAAYFVQSGWRPAGWFGDPYPADALPPLERLEIASETLGMTFPVYVQLPHGYGRDRERRYPVFYATDGDASVELYDDIVLPALRRGTIPEIIFVSVAFPRRMNRGGISHFRDRAFTPPASEALEDGDHSMAAEFLGFLADELAPAIDARYRTQPGERGIGGHAQGGLFVLYAALTRPEAFGRHFVSTPWVDVNDRAIFGIAQRQLHAREEWPARIYYGYPVSVDPSLVQANREMADYLGNARDAGLDIRFREWPRGSSAEGIVVQAATSGLEFLFE
jgi:uncharacterized protein